MTLYGVMNGGVNQVKATTSANATTTTTANNASGAWASNRLGFTGSEDLGGGMKAAFTYELGMNSDGSGDLTTSNVRQSHVTLSSASMGSINFGRNYNPHFLLNIAYDAGAANNLAYGRTTYSTSTGEARSSNLATYTSPTIAGFTAKVASGTNTVDASGSETGTKNTGASITYANGPLSVGYGMHKLDAVNVAGDKDQSLLGASYKMGAATLVASFGNTKTKDAAGAQSAKRATSQVGVRYPFGKVDTFLSYGNATENTTAGSADKKTTAYQAGAIYNFSKRTGLYAAYGKNKVKSSSEMGSELAVGVRHSF